jgi:hypothetical protein
MTREEKKIEKESHNFECILCHNVIATSLASLNYHNKKQHPEHKKQGLGVTYRYTKDSPKNEVPRKQRKRKTHRKVLNDDGNEVLVPIVRRWEETDAAIELYGKDKDAYLAELERHYPYQETYLDEDEDHNGGVESGGDYEETAFIP